MEHDQQAALMLQKLQHGQKCVKRGLNNETIYKTTAPLSTTSAQYAKARPDLASIDALGELFQHTRMDELLPPWDVCLSVIKQSVQNTNS